LELPVVVDALHAKLEAAIYASLALLMAFVHSLGAPFATLTPCYCLLFPHVHHNVSSERSFFMPERLAHHSVHALDGNRKLASVPRFIPASDAISDYH